MERYLEISPTTEQSEVHAQIPVQNHFQNPMTYLHAACGHHYHDDGSDIRDKELVPYYTDGEEDPFTIFLLTPRWCVECLSQRELAIRASYYDRLIQMESIEQAVGTVEEAYIRGVHDGRISALAQSFESCGLRAGVDESPDLDDPQDFDEVVEKLTAMGLGTNEPTEDNKIEDIVQNINDQMELDDDELQHDLYWHMSYMDGKQDGCYMQAQLEYKALLMVEPNRSEMLKRALL